MSEDMKTYTAELNLDCSNMFPSEEVWARKWELDQIRSEVDAILKKTGGSWVYDASEYGDSGKDTPSYAILVFRASGTAAEEIGKLQRGVIYGPSDPVPYALKVMEKPSSPSHKKTGPTLG